MYSPSCLYAADSSHLAALATRPTQGVRSRPTNITTVYIVWQSAQQLRAACKTTNPAEDLPIKDIEDAGGCTRHNGPAAVETTTQ